MTRRTRPLLAVAPVLLASSLVAPVAGCGLLWGGKGGETGGDDGAPMLNIVSPAANAVIAESVGVELVVIASDDDTSPEQFTMTWVSDVDGAVDGPTGVQSDGTARANLTLSPGPHTLTGTLVDGDGDVDTATRSFVVDGMPGAPDVVITPADPGAADELVGALAFQPDLDPEGEDVTLRWAWLVDGETTTERADRVSASETAEGEVWTVQVWASDSRQEGPPGVAEAVIGP